MRFRNTEGVLIIAFTAFISPILCYMCESLYMNQYIQRATQRPRLQFAAYRAEAAVVLIITRIWNKSK